MTTIKRNQFVKYNSNGNFTKYVRLRGRRYIHTCRSTSTRRATFHERSICSETFTVG